MESTTSPRASSDFPQHHEPLPASMSTASYAGSGIRSNGSSLKRIDGRIVAVPNGKHQKGPVIQKGFSTSPVSSVSSGLPHQHPQPKAQLQPKNGVKLVEYQHSTGQLASPSPSAVSSTSPALPPATSLASHLAVTANPNTLTAAADAGSAYSTSPFSPPTVPNTLQAADPSSLPARPELGSDVEAESFNLSAAHAHIDPASSASESLKRNDTRDLDIISNSTASSTPTDNTMSSTTSNGLHNKALEQVIRTPDRKPSPQPSSLNVPGSSMSRMLPDQSPGYVAPKFEGKDEQMEQGECS
jgi:hypothetical protein